MALWLCTGQAATGPELEQKRQNSYPSHETPPFALHSFYKNMNLCNAECAYQEAAAELFISGPGVTLASSA